MHVELITVAEADKSVLENLMQLYLYDFSEIHCAELTSHGTFTYPYLDNYFTETTRRAYFLTADHHLAGFALIRDDVSGDVSWDVAEFFVVRRYRRTGVARSAATQLFLRHPGNWTVSFQHANAIAAAFWPKVVALVSNNSATATNKYPPDVNFATTEIRFQIAAR